ncbi:hypothetical protein [Janthinobacterium psychrotolerans]|uniref:Uncharacterized protein n=1 Tax=Janthinobacterium psychrotolerans TaxID=1747903 RepID=A0A1A7C9W3_9BURK|nr:hypothetical protein [Janthinobacterium psychrotolerans]OBV41555.1 hypothetical protein ASR47_103429 [Janthinobacterium psychrotolerans]
MPLRPASTIAGFVHWASHALKRLPGLLACLGATGLLSGCASTLSAGMTYEHAVAYPMRSPEYVLRDLGGKRYLLAQWDVPLNGNAVQRVRYYDRNTGMLAPLPESVTVFRDDYLGKSIGAVRHDSDNPQVVAFFTRREPGRNSYCKETPSSAAVASPRQLCGRLELVLSLDGGRSFGLREIAIPESMGRGISVRRYEFIIARDNTLYFGIFINSGNLPRICCTSSNGGLANANGVIYARRFDGPATTGGDQVFLAVLAMPLPDATGTPLPAAQIPKQLSADFLSGPALEAFDLGRPMARLAMPATPEPAAPIAQYRRADRENYIASLRAAYPQWAAHQRLDTIPLREQTMSPQELQALRAKQLPREDDPIEWIRFDSPAN